MDWSRAGSSGLPRHDSGQQIDDVFMLVHSSVVVRSRPVTDENTGTHVTVPPALMYSHLNAQDCRGRGDSEGHFEPLNEQEDGAQTVEWITHQAWYSESQGIYLFGIRSTCALKAYTHP